MGPFQDQNPINKRYFNLNNQEGSISMTHTVEAMVNFVYRDRGLKRTPIYDFFLSHGKNTQGPGENTDL
jgi:hypothetical protein